MKKYSYIFGMLFCMVVIVVIYCFVFKDKKPKEILIEDLNIELIDTPPTDDPYCLEYPKSKLCI